jgi:hypothetical protein
VKFKSVSSSSAVTKAAATAGACFIYNRKTGELFLDTNLGQSGFGEEGGLIATLTNKPRLTAANIAYYTS